jgi:hypothetical protein
MHVKEALKLFARGRRTDRDEIFAVACGDAAGAARFAGASSLP